LKPENILRYADGRFAIADLGLSRIARRSVLNSRHSTGVGTTEYAAPEIGFAGYTNAIDVFSFGLLLLECAHCFRYGAFSLWSEVNKSKRKQDKGLDGKPADSVKDELLSCLREEGYLLFQSKLI
jgi:serine/threonine protein kinase